MCLFLYIYFLTWGFVLFSFYFSSKLPLENFPPCDYKAGGEGEVPSQLENIHSPSFPSLAADEAEAETDREVKPLEERKDSCDHWFFPAWGVPSL